MTSSHLPAFIVERRAGLLDFWTAYEQVMDHLPATSTQAALRELVGAPPVAQLVAQLQQSRPLLRSAILDGDWQPYVAYTRGLAGRYAELGISFSRWYSVIRVFQHRLIPELVDAYATTPARLVAALLAMTEFFDFTIELLADQHLETRTQVRFTLEQRTRQLEHANRELETFSYSVAHDLRAPLRGIHGFAQVLLEDHAAQLDADAAGYLNKIQANATQMGALIDALLGLSRLARGELELQAVDLTALSCSVVAQLTAAEPARRVDVRIDHGLRATADVRLARTVLENLIGNAWKFTGNAPAPQIAVGTTDGRTFFVRDNGAGFDVAHAGKLFAPFERLHTTDEFPGTGVGLATVQRIVHRHGGRITVEAQPGVGATFSFTLDAAGA